MVSAVTFTYNPPPNLRSTGLTPSQANMAWDAATLISTATSLLIHGDGTIVDTSGNSNVLTNAGSVVFDTIAPKFGSGALKFTAINTSSGQKVSTPILSGSVLDILSGAGDFTIEGWFKLTNTSTANFAICDYGDTVSVTDKGLVLTASLASGGSFTLQTSIRQGGAGAFWGPIGGNTPLTADTWYHFAVVRSSGTGMLFLNGVSQGTAPSWVSYVFPATSLVQFGWTASISGSLNPGMIDEVRVSKGVALYTANFTPPAAPFIDPGPPPGYTLYRDGIELVQLLGAILTYSDLGVLPGETHAYKVAAQDGLDLLLSDFSNILTVTIPFADGRAFGKFAGAAATYPPFVLANAKGIIPKIYMPLEDVTARSKKK